MSSGVNIKHVDIGGGLGVSYKGEKPPSVSDYLDLVLPEIRKRNLKLVVEPGRSIIANAGILVTKVLFLKVNYWFKLNDKNEMTLFFRKCFQSYSLRIKTAL